MKTFRYLNAYVKTISHINVLSKIVRFHKHDIETTLMTCHLLSQYGMNKVINIFCKRGLRAVQKRL